VSDLLAAPWRIAEATIPTEIVLESHDAAGGTRSLAGGACALGEVGWTFGSVRFVQRH